MTGCKTTCHPLSYDRAIKRGTEHDDNPEILPPEHGHFSRPFFRRTRLALELAPSTVEHVVGLYTARSTSEDAIQATKEAPIPMNAQAWDDANEIYALLVYWCRSFARELKIQAPGPAARAAQNVRGTIVGLPSGLTADQARYVTGVMGQWLRIQLEPIMWLDPDDVTQFAANVADVFRINARWPQRDRAVWSKLPCPSCGGRLAIWPPADDTPIAAQAKGRRLPKGGDRRIVCESCQTSMTDAEYQAEVDRVAVATKEAQALVAKYGRQIAGEWRL